MYRIWHAWLVAYATRGIYGRCGMYGTCTPAQMAAACTPPGVRGQDRTKIPRRRCPPPPFGGFPCGLLAVTRTYLRRDLADLGRRTAVATCAIAGSDAGPDGRGVGWLHLRFISPGPPGSFAGRCAPSMMAAFGILVRKWDGRAWCCFGHSAFVWCAEFYTEISAPRGVKSLRITALNIRHDLVVRPGLVRVELASKSPRLFQNLRNFTPDVAALVAASLSSFAAPCIATSS